MGKILVIAVCVPSLFITSAYCCLLSGSGEYGGPCSSVGRQRFSYGGRIALVERGAGLVAPPPWANQRLFVFRMPLSFSKIKHRRSIFGHKGIIGIMSHGVPCAGHIPLQNDCPLTTTQDFASVCLDPTLPCYKTPPSYSQSEPLSLSNITPTSITVTWQPWDENVDVGNGPIVGYIIEIRKVGEAVFTKILKGIQFSHQFDNLEENTEYEFRITVIRDHPFGEGQPSNIQRCTTPSNREPTYTNMEPLVFEDVTSSSVNVSWPEWDPKVDRGTGPVTGYKILYREQGTHRWQIILIPTDLSTQLTGLLQHTTYELVIKLGYGNDSFSTRTNVQTVTTKCKDIDGIDLHLSSRSTTSGYATISARWSFDALESCVVRQNLTIEQLDSDGCRNPPSPGEFSLEASLEGTIRKFTKKHLEAYSEYNVSITFMTVTNDIYYQSAKIRTSSSEPTGRPLNVRREETTSNGRVILRWDKPACGSRHGEIERYEFEFRRKDGSNIIRKGSTKNHRKRFTALDIGDRYSFRVRAVTDKGRGPWKIIVRVFGQ